MKTRTRADRRAYAGRAKVDARRKLIADGMPTNPRWVGRTAAMHGTCPCGMCTTPMLKHTRPETSQRDLRRLGAV